MCGVGLCLFLLADFVIGEYGKNGQISCLCLVMLVNSCVIMIVTKRPNVYND